MSDRELLSLLDWRRRVTGLYAEVRALRGKDPQAAHDHWRVERDRLFAAHPQSPLHEERRGNFRGLPVYPYDRGLAFGARIELLPTPERSAFRAPDGGDFVRIGLMDLPVATLDVYWLDVYGGGLFLPFRDATAGWETYEGGRYLLDTTKGADLGETSEGMLVVDFNFAYHPSCAYSPIWSCPLAPAGNRIEGAIRAGESLLPG